jgi:hypothetical protein
LNYIRSLTIIDEEYEMVEEYPKHDMSGEFHVYLSHNLLDITAEDVKQFVSICALKQILIFQKDQVAKESDNEMLEDSVEWLISEDSDGLDVDEEETSDSGYEYDKESAEKAEKNVNRFENHIDFDMSLRERIDPEEDEITNE